MIHIFSQSIAVILQLFGGTCFGLSIFGGRQLNGMKSWSKSFLNKLSYNLIDVGGFEPSLFYFFSWFPFLVISVLFFLLLILSTLFGINIMIKGLVWISISFFALQTLLLVINLRSWDEIFAFILPPFGSLGVLFLVPLGLSWLFGVQILDKVVLWIAVLLFTLQVALFMSFLVPFAISYRVRLATLVGGIVLYGVGIWVSQI